MASLHLSESDRWIAGVAGGIAETYGWEPPLVRIGWIVAGVVVAPAAIIGYVVLWASLRKRPSSEATSSAVGIAEERYARGEIDAEELRRIKNDLGAT